MARAMFSDYVGDEERERLNQAGSLELARNPDEIGTLSPELLTTPEEPEGQTRRRIPASQLFLGDWIGGCVALPRWAREGRRARDLAVQHEALPEAQRGKRPPMPQHLTRGKYQGHYVTAKYWGITMLQLRVLYEECQRDEKWDARDDVKEFVRKFVTPTTAKTKMGYALWLNADSPQEVTLMVSHAWAESVDEFFRDVLESTQDNEVAFICFLSNYQGSAEEIDEQLGDDILNCPFTEVLRNPSCQRMLVVPNKALKGEVGGLYSRLWCDWEIKCAADSGLPIHFVTGKDDSEYLWGTGAHKSSRMATCGSTHDEMLIKEAIEKMRAETRSFQAASFSVVAACSAFGPIIGVVLFESWYAWALGFIVGPLTGLGIVQFTGNRVRSRMNTEDGYGTLDGVIELAAERKYSCRSFSWRRDMPEVIICMGLGGVLDIFGRWCLEQAGFLEPEAFDGGLHYFVHFLEGLGTGLLLWVVFRPNKVGPWTNIFFPRKFDRVLLSLWFTLILITVYLINKTFDRQLRNEGDDSKAECAGEACMLSLIFLLALLSLFHENVWHFLGLMTILGWLIVTLCWNPALWRETLILLAGAAGIQLTPWKKEHLHIRIFFTTLSVVAVGTLFAMPWIFKGYHKFWRCEHCLWGGSSCDIRVED